MLVTMDASLRAWRTVVLDHQFQECWSCQEAQLAINVWELRAIAKALQDMSDLLKGHAIRIQADNATEEEVREAGPP